MLSLRLCLAALVLFGSSAFAQTSRPPSPAALVLVPGAGGASPRDFLVLSTRFFEAAGLTTVMTTSAGEASRLVSDLQSRGFRVTLVGMSLGAVTAAQAVASGSRPDRIVFAAGGLLPPGTPNGSVVGTLGTPSQLPPTLVLHHREDACRMTPPSAVEDFVRWSRGRARVAWITGGGGPGPPCRPDTPHTFTDRENVAAAAIIQFAKSR